MTNTPAPTVTPTTGQPTTTPTGQPTFGGRDIGVTYFAISGLRDRLLADVGLTFEDSLLLNGLAGRGGSATRDELATVLVDGLKIDPDVAAAHVDGLVAPRWRPTPGAASRRPRSASRRTTGSPNASPRTLRSSTGASPTRTSRSRGGSWRS